MGLDDEDLDMIGEEGDAKSNPSPQENKSAEKKEEPVQQSLTSLLKETPKDKPKSIQSQPEKPLNQKQAPAQKAQNAKQTKKNEKKKIIQTDSATSEEKVSVSKNEIEQIPSIERILGEEYTLSQAQGSQPGKASLKNATKFKDEEEAISNSNSPFENEQILREHEDDVNRGKIELEIELTADQKKLDDALMFGSFPKESLIGIGINSSQQQRELRDFKNQG